MLNPSTLDAIDRYWAGFFGCAPPHFAGETLLVLPHVGLGEYSGVWLFMRDASGVISAPPAYCECIAAAIGTRQPREIWEQDLLALALRAEVERVVGPAYVGYADAGTLAAPAGGARLLADGDEPALVALRQACAGLDWKHGGSEPGAQPLAGAFVGASLVALAGYELWGAEIAHIAVVTRPGYRGQGYGAAVVSLLAAHAVQLGLIPQYRTLLANGPSLRVAARLGFQPYAETLALRLGQR
ncbi:MAG TPA: GNAT family N-acetyltransferase [Herpetosiphonaceae bacterium]|nr:GNAT family N-acetyltransferase [Herpetosiphonaceae bacterium]